MIVATHLNTKSLHNHFILNSASHIHGCRCQKTQWWKIRKLSDEICRKYGLSIVEKPKGKKLPYPIAVAEKKGESTRLIMVREAVDTAISISPTMTEFHQALKAMGYTCNLDSNRKYWTTRQLNWQRPIRLYRLGEDYTNERIAQRVRGNPTAVRDNRYQLTIHKRNQYRLPTRYDRIKKMGGIGGLYLHYCYLLGYLPKYNQSTRRVHYLLRDDLLKMNSIAEETRFIYRNDIRDETQLNQMKDKSENQIQMLTGKREVYYNIIRRRGSSEEELNEHKEKISAINDELKN